VLGFHRRLERKLRAELNSARIAYLNDLSKGGRRNRDLAGGREISEVRTIEYIEALGAKLQLHLAVLAETNVLKEREVYSLSWWPLDDSAAAIPDHIGDRWRDGRFLKAGRIEPNLESVRAAKIWIANNIGPVTRD
jgi:hypothetical protein